MECWNRCAPAVLRYQIHWLIFWTLVIEKRKKRRRKTRMDEFDFDDFHVKAMVKDDLTLIA